MGTGASVREENEDLLQNSGQNPMRPTVFGIEDETNEHEIGIAEQAQTEKGGWTRSLSLLPSFNAEKIYDRMIKNSITMPKKGAAPKAFRNKKHGYKLWKEGYVRGVLVKPNVKGKRLLSPMTGESSSLKQTTHAQTTGRAIVRPNSHKWKPASKAVTSTAFDHCDRSKVAATRTQIPLILAKSMKVDKGHPDEKVLPNPGIIQWYPRKFWWHIQGFFKDILELHVELDTLGFELRQWS